MLVDENDKVKAGQLLAQIDDQDYSAAYNQVVADQSSVQADLEQAAQDYERISQACTGPGRFQVRITTRPWPGTAICRPD